MSTKLSNLYRAACAAKAAWYDEQERVYGGDAGDAFYDWRRVATPKLRQLHDEFRTAEDNWRETTMRQSETSDALKSIVVKAIAAAYSTSVENVRRDLTALPQTEDTLNQFCLLMQRAGY